MKLVRWLLWLIGAVLIGITVFAIATYPTLGEVTSALAGDTNADVIGTWRELRSDWLASIKDLGQIFLFSPFVPLLAAVIGYIFGRRPEEQDDDG